MHHAYYTAMAGGLGDILMYYSEGDHAYLKALKTERADGKETTTKVITYSVSDQVYKLFEHHPYIDVKDHRPFAPDLRDTSLEDYAARHAGAGFHPITPYVRNQLSKESRPPFYLDPSEADLAAHIIGTGPYIAIHPFAGAPDRDLASQVRLDGILAKLCETQCVVMLGGSSYRLDRDVPMPERSVWSKRPNLFDLVNVGTVRLHAHMTAKAAKFIGTASAYNCVAHQHRVPTQLWTNATNRKCIATEPHGIFAMVRDQGTAVHYFDQMPANPAAEMIAFANR